MNARSRLVLLLLAASPLGCPSPNPPADAADVQSAETSTGDARDVAAEGGGEDATGGEDAASEDAAADGVGPGDAMRPDADMPDTPSPDGGGACLMAGAPCVVGDRCCGMLTCRPGPDGMVCGARP